MSSRDLRRVLAQLLGLPPQGAREYVATGAVSAVSEDEDFGYAYQVDLDDGRTVTARACWPGQTGRVGRFDPLDEDTEVVVALPYGDPNAAIIIGTPSSAEQRPPSSWDHDRISTVHPGGSEFRGSETGSVEDVVVRQFLTDFSTALQSLSAGLDTEADGVQAASTAAGTLKTASTGPLSGLAAGFTALKAAFVVELAGVNAQKSAVDSLKQQIDLSLNETSSSSHLSAALKAEPGPLPE